MRVSICEAEINNRVTIKIGTAVKSFSRYTVRSLSVLEKQIVNSNNLDKQIDSK